MLYYILHIVTAGRSPNITDYCQCLPKCSRTEYRVTQSQAKLSKHTTRVLTLNTALPDNLDELTSIQNWTSIGATRKAYAVMLDGLDYTMYECHVAMYDAIQELQTMLAQHLIK